MSRFIDPTTDFGFKKIFGDEANKDIIMGFITDVLELATPLLDINFKDKEIPGFFKGDEVFEKAFEVARYAKLTRKERRRYELNIKRMRDTYTVLMGSYETGYDKGYDTGYDKGHNKGRIEEAQNTLKLVLSQKLGAMPLDIDEAIRGLNDIEQIRRILAQFTSINDLQTLQNYLPKRNGGNHA